MGIFSSIKKKVVKAVKEIAGIDDNQKDAAKEAQKAADAQVKLLSAQGNEDVRKKMEAMRANPRRRGRATRGRDSTIITQGSEIQSRTLLG